MKQACKQGVEKLNVSDRTKSNLKAGCEALSGAKSAAIFGIFGNSDRIGDEKPNHVEKISRDQEKADSMRSGQV